MAKMDSKSETYVKGLWEQLKTTAQGMSIAYGPGYANQRLSEADEDMLWDKRAMSIEQEWELHRQRKTRQEQLPDGSVIDVPTDEPMYTREEIGLKVFPEREKLVKSGGRIEPRDWYQAAERFAARAEKRRMQQPSSIDGEGVL